MNTRTKIVIIGGGIAGVTCLDTLLTDHKSIDSHITSITLVSETRVIKKVVNHITSGRNLESFDIEAGDLNKFYPAESPRNLNFEFVVGDVVSIDGDKRLISVESSTETGTQHKAHLSVRYDVLCLANGSSPKRLSLPDELQTEVLDRILTIRDTTSVQRLRRRLVSAQEVTIIGNGGISLELVHKIINCDIFWVIQDEFVGHPLLDSGASKFLLEAQSKDRLGDESLLHKLGHYDLADEIAHNSTIGPALGPHWLDGTTLTGAKQGPKAVQIQYNAEVVRFLPNETDQDKLRVILRDGQIIETDLVIVAIGVVPNQIRFTSGEPDISSTDGGILIDTEMRTSMKDIYAAGDVVSCERWPQDTLWFQMRLWTQARQMGQYCAKCIAAHMTKDDPVIFSNFECFTHVTSFLGFKLVLLGRYSERHLRGADSQRLEIIARVSRGRDYIKLVLRDDRVIGAILVGNTDLEETVENLIYDQINICDIKHQLLDDTIDIEDYFD